MTSFLAAIIVVITDGGKPLLFKIALSVAMPSNATAVNLDGPAGLAVEDLFLVVEAMARPEVGTG